MPVIAAALFGSRARGDHEPHSDTDILFVTCDKYPRHVVRDNLSISSYSSEYLTEKARSGDLFLCHIATEAKLLYDDADNFSRIVDAFTYKASYEYEIRCATELGTFLVHYGLEFTSGLEVNRKIAWCVRTILIAKSAEVRQPVFSPTALAGFAGSQDVLQLIRQRSDGRVSQDMLARFFDFLWQWGAPDIERGKLQSEDYYKVFSISDNKLGLQTYNKNWLEIDPSYL
jgi:predicted nucleotidyltransferase